MRYLNKDVLAERIARESGHDVDVVARACDFQFLFIAEKIRGGNYEKGVRLSNFGLFGINSKYLERVRARIMTIKELQRHRAIFGKRREGMTRVHTDLIKALIDTALALHDRLGDENDVPSGKAELARKGAAPTY